MQELELLIGTNLGLLDSHDLIDDIVDQRTKIRKVYEDRAA